MTHVNRSTRIAIASAIAALGLSLSIVTPGTAQSARTEQATSPRLSSEPQSLPTTSPSTPEQVDLYKSLHRPEIVNEEEEQIRARRATVTDGDSEGGARSKRGGNQA